MSSVTARAIRAKNRLRTKQIADAKAAIEEVDAGSKRKAAPAAASPRKRQRKAPRAPAAAAAASAADDDDPSQRVPAAAAAVAAEPEVDGKRVSWGDYDKALVVSGVIANNGFACLTAQADDDDNNILMDRSYVTLRYMVDGSDELRTGYGRVQQFRRVGPTIKVDMHWLYELKDLSDYDRAELAPMLTDEPDALILTNAEHEADLSDVIGALPVDRRPTLHYDLDTHRVARIIPDAAVAAATPVVVTKDNDEAMIAFLAADRKYMHAVAFGASVLDEVTRKVERNSKVTEMTEKFVAAWKCGGFKFSEAPDPKRVGRCEFCGRRNKLVAYLDITLPDSDRGEPPILVGECCDPMFSNIKKLNRKIGHIRTLWRAMKDSERSRTTLHRQWWDELAAILALTEPRPRSLLPICDDEPAPAAAAAAEVN